MAPGAEGKAVSSLELVAFVWLKPKCLTEVASRKEVFILFVTLGDSVHGHLALCTPSEHHSGGCLQRRLLLTS